MRALPLAALVLASLAAGCILEKARRDGAQCSSERTCPRGQECSKDGQCLYPCPMKGCSDAECGCGDIDRGDTPINDVHFICLDGLCHFGCGNVSGDGFSVCQNFYMACDTSRQVCLPACGGPADCIAGTTCSGSATPTGGPPPNYCYATGVVDDGGVVDGDGGGGDGPPQRDDGGSTSTTYRHDFLTIPAEPVALVAGDLSWDTPLDLVVVARWGARAYVFEGAGDGTFTQMQEHILSSIPFWVGSADFDHESPQGIPADFVFLHEGDLQLDVRLGTGSGDMTYKGQSGTLDCVPASGQGPAAAVGRLGASGRGGLAVACGAGVQTAVSDGQGNLAITPPHAVPQPVAVVAVDYNNDGTDDLVALSASASGSLHALTADGTGEFTAGPTFTPYSGAGVPVALAAGRLDGDTLPDFAVAFGGHGPNAIALTYNWPNGSVWGGFIADGANFTALVTGDFDGDGRIDVGGIAPTGPGQGEFVFFANLGGSFGVGQRYPLAGSPVAVVVGRFNGDGCDDVAVALPDEAKVEVLVSLECP